MIDSYTFGRIVIDGREYTADVIVLPDRVKSGWWRKEGHQLCTEDIEAVLREGPEALVVGTGYYGLMKVLPETRERLKKEGIRLVAEKTKEACEAYNSLLRESKKAAAALHLTC